jgi:hypothetical protein
LFELYAYGLPINVGTAKMTVSISGELTDTTGDGVSIGGYGTYLVQESATRPDTELEVGNPFNDPGSGSRQIYTYPAQVNSAIFPGPHQYLGQYVGFYLSGNNDIAVLNGRTTLAPIPGSLLLLGSGIMGLVGMGIRRKSG